MTALNDLTAEVRFRERIRGYDVGEVDDYVKAVNHAAAQALEHVSALQERVRQLESQQGGDTDTEEARETLVRTLVLAQRTADTAVAEARLQAEAITGEATESAAAMVSEAEAAAGARLESAADEAARVLAEGEENCRLIIAETKRTAAAEMAAERERVLEELQTLTEAKAAFEAETARISARLEHERARMHEFLASFRAFVEATAAVSAAAPSPAGGARAGTADEGGRTASIGTSPAEGARAETADEGEGAAPAPSGDGQSEPDSTLTESVPDVPLVRWLEDTETQDPGETRDAGERSLLSGDVPEPVAHRNAGTHGRGSETASEPMSLATQAWPVAEAGPQGLFDAGTDEDDEFVQQLRRVVNSDAPSPDRDEAMSAFFDHDDSESGGRGGGSTRTANTNWVSRRGRRS